MLKIRLSRVGRKKQPFFKIVVIPKSRPPKGGRFTDQVGTYDPVNKDVSIDKDKARGWIAKGAKPSGTVHNLFVKYGVLTGKKVKVHDKDPVEPEPKKPEEEEKEESKAEKEEEKEKKEEEGKDEKESEKKKNEPKKKEDSKKEEKDSDKKEEKGKKDKKDEGLDSLDLTTRIVNALEEAGIKTVEELKKKKKEELEEIKGLGEKSIEKILEIIK